MDFINNLSPEIMSKVLDYLPTLALALLTLVIGMWLIGKLSHFLTTRLESSGMDLSLSRFVASGASTLMRVMLLLSVVGMFGVNTTSFIAVISALMVGVGMALNGTIGHVASGVLLMVFKPFKVGDIVVVGSGHRGLVESITAFNTVLKTLDNKRIIINNSNIIGNDITNISGQDVIGVELTYDVAYNTDIEKARQVILDVGKKCPLILKDPSQGVVVSELATSSVKLATRPFCKSEHYWDVAFYMNEQVYKEFIKAKIDIPFPQLTIHNMNQA